MADPDNEAETASEYLRALLKDRMVVASLYHDREVHGAVQDGLALLPRLLRGGQGRHAVILCMSLDHLLLQARANFARRVASMQAEVQALRTEMAGVDKGQQEALNGLLALLNDSVLVEPEAVRQIIALLKGH